MKWSLLMLFSASLLFSGEICKGVSIVREEESLLSEMERASLEQKLESFKGYPIDRELLLTIKREICSFYQEAGKPVLEVYFPEQEIAASRLVVKVDESKRGDVRVIGNRWFSSKAYSSAIRIPQGGPIEVAKVIEDVAWLNQNPFRLVDAVFTPGKGRHTTDIELAVRDRFPLRVYAGTDNTGFQDTGPGRFFTGFQWGNASMLGHILSYQFTSDYRFSRLIANTVNYKAPLSWKHIFTVFGGAATVKAPMDFDFSPRSHGHSYQASGRYQIPLPMRNNLLHAFWFGYDFKRTNNNVEFGGEIVNKNYVNLSQFLVGYDLTFTPVDSKTYFSVEAVFAPFAIPDQENSRFFTFHPFARNKYLYARFALEHLHNLPWDFQFMGTFRAQASTTNLLPSEQLGLGGYDSVRGYAERQVNVDAGAIATVEVRSPTLTPIRYFYTKKPSWSDPLQFLVFADFGVGSDIKKFSGQRSIYTLLGIGPGVRYSISSYATARFDWGFQLIRTINTEFRSHPHFSFILSY